MPNERQDGKLGASAATDAHGIHGAARNFQSSASHATTSNMPLHEKLMEIVIKRSILLPSCEIYGPQGGFFDYGPIGALIKHNVENAWREHFLLEDGFLEIESSLILPQAPLIASGHASNFTDPIVNCTKCKHRFRADALIEEKTNHKMEGASSSDIANKLAELKISCPDCKGALSDVGYFNMMFTTNVGPVDGNLAYLRPETAQGIFMDFQRIFRNSGSKLPLAIGQVGHSFRNEISPRQGLVRMREFTQMEIEYFFDPENPKMQNFANVADEKIPIIEVGKDEHRHKDKIAHLTASEAVSSGTVPNEIMAYFMAKQIKFYQMCGIPYEKMHFRKLAANETPHYSKGNFDLEVQTSYGLIETIGNAYRTDFDLSSHATHSKQDLAVLIDDGSKRRIIPHVVEPSMGVDRMFWCILEATYRPATKEKEWEWFDLPPVIAPYLACVFPLMKKDGMSEAAQQIVADLRSNHLAVQYSETGSIGKRYARADEIGVPYCMTIDYTTLEDKTVTLRFRNDGKQVRIKIDEIEQKLREYAKEGKVTVE